MIPTDAKEMSSMRFNRPRDVDHLILSLQKKSCHLSQRKMNADRPDAYASDNKDGEVLKDTLKRNLIISQRPLTLPNPSESHSHTNMFHREKSRHLSSSSKLA